MLKQIIKIICGVVIILSANKTFAATSEITIKELVTGGQEGFHLRILKAIPESGQISIGPKDAKNTIIEFFDYKCGYCVKIHPELVELTNKRNDLRVVFIQLPILSEMSAKLARLVLAANYQNKGYEIHHALLTQKGALTEKKINKIILDSNIDYEKIKKDLERPEIDETLAITSFLASAIGARGTPALFINNNFNPGYVPQSTIEKLLK